MSKTDISVLTVNERRARVHDPLGARYEPIAGGDVTEHHYNTSFQAYRAQLQEAERTHRNLKERIQVHCERVDKSENRANALEKELDELKAKVSAEHLARLKELVAKRRPAPKAKARRRS